MTSARGKALLSTPPPLVVAHFACKKDPYDAQSNPGGYINLGTAENYLLWDVLEEKLRSFGGITAQATHYDFPGGSLALRTGLAEFLRDQFHARREITPDSIIVGAGTSTLLDMISFALCEEGEGILIPAPYYSGFNADLRARARVVPIPVPLSSTDGYELSVSAFQQALAEARHSGIRVRAILLSSPNNPLGKVYSEPSLRALISFAKENDLHCILDEIYAHSVYAESGPRFVSGLSFPPGDSRHVHFIYGFAKDFGLSGFKIGVFHSLDQELVAVMRELVYFSPVSTYTQALMTEMISDRKWVTRLLDLNRERLGRTYSWLQAQLRTEKIHALDAQAGFFLWLDLRDRLESPTMASETRLWERVFKESRVSILPGSTFASNEPGWFRLCFAHPEPLLSEAVRRLKLVL